MGEALNPININTDMNTELKKTFSELEGKESRHLDAHSTASAHENESLLPLSSTKRSTSSSSETNPILQTFRTLSAAKAAMRKIAKNTKEHSTLQKKHWEHISKEISEHHETAVTSSQRLQLIAVPLQIAIAIVPMYLTGAIPNLSKEDLRNNPLLGNDSQTYEAWIESLKDGWLDKAFSYMRNEPLADFVLSCASNKESLSDWIKKGQGLAKGASEPILQNWGQSTQMENQRDTAIAQQQQQAAQSEYQSRKDEKSQEEQIASNIEQNLQRLMEQEARTFEMRG